MSSLPENRGIAFLIVFVMMMFSCALLEEENKTTIRHEYYAFEPDTILVSLANGDGDAFSLTMNEIDYSVLPPGPTVNWKQTDYFYIVEAFYKEILDDSLQGWRLNSMGFFLRCDEIDYGLQDGRFELFKVIKDEDDREVRMFRFIDIDARYEQVSFREEKHYPKLLDWSFIDFDNLKIDAEEALQIAENSGGKEVRISAPDSCGISVGLAPDSASFSGWRVSYKLAESPTSFFSIEIDPVTGESK